MQTIMKLSVAVIAAVALAGCGVQNGMKHTASSIFGLNRQITLYSADGKIIKQWRTRAKIEDNGGSVWFIADGKAITVSGTFLIEEL